MACHPPIFEEDLQGTGGNADINLFFDKLIRHAVIVAIDLDMVVDIDSGFFPFRGDLISDLLSARSRWSERITAVFVVEAEKAR